MLQAEAKMQRLLTVAERLAKNITILIRGETEQAKKCWRYIHAVVIAENLFSH